MSAEHILIVDDERAIQTSLRGVLEDEGYRVTTVGSAEEALARLADDAPDLVFLDIWMPGMDGLEALAEIKQRRPETAVVMISGHGTIETAVKATKLGAYDFVEKPLSLEKTLLVVERTLEHARLEQQHRQLRERVERGQEIVGKSAVIEEMRQQIAVAEQQTPVALRQIFAQKQTDPFGVAQGHVDVLFEARLGAVDFLFAGRLLNHAVDGREHGAAGFVQRFRLVEDGAEHD